MTATVDKYLARRAAFERWPLEGDAGTDTDRAVVIPALGEHEALPRTLNALADSPADARAKTLVIVVVNNRAPAYAGADDIESNRATLDGLRRGAHPELRLAWLDAASPGRELPVKGGVGDARKIGLDHGLRILRECKRLHGPLISLDADTDPDHAYLGAIRDHFDVGSTWGATIPFAHRLEGGRGQRQAILHYEAHLRYYVLGLRYAGSRYAFHTVGSAMACTARAYAAVGGMKKRQAAEDFYFLQDLAKTGLVEGLRGTVVRPSSRVSHRVPFGTGAHLGKRKGLETPSLETYAPESFRVLRDWLALWDAERLRAGAALLSLAAEIHPELARYLAAVGFAGAWDKLLGNGQADQGYRWFDALKTLRLLHHLRDTAHPNVALRDAIRAIPGWFDGKFDGALETAVAGDAVCTATLDALREMEFATGFNPDTTAH